MLDSKYGKRGNAKREKWEQEFEAFRLGVLLEEARIKMGMTQEELAEKCGTNKSYISRIENNSSDIRLSTLIPEALKRRTNLYHRPDDDAKVQSFPAGISPQYYNRKKVFQ